MVNNSNGIKTNNHLSPQTQRKTTIHGVGQLALDTNKRGMVELANDIPRLTISLWISNDNSYINKHRLAVPQKGHTLVTKMNDKINMD
jgi:hypothetical protein